MESAKEWSIPPWEVEGKEPTRWVRLVWRYRRNFYTGEYNSKIRREQEKIELRQLQNG